MTNIKRGGLAGLGSLFLFLSPLVYSADEPTALLEPIRVSSTATEYLQTDLIHPVDIKKPHYSNGSGSLDQSLGRDFPVHILTSGSPGTVTAFRGFGLRSEDTNVQTLGVSLNPAYGGGFDFSTMPFFLWSSYRYQVGQASASFDPRASSGVVSLTPWTADAINEKPTESFPLQPFIMASSLGQQQIAIRGIDQQREVAFSAGQSLGLSQGPSGTMSVKKSLGFQDSLRFHLIATDLTSRVPGTTTAPTPLTTQRTMRAMPVINWDHETDSLISKLTFYTDLTNIYYRSPEYSYETFDQARVFGANYAIGFSGWKFGLLGRRLIYKTSITTPDEDLGQAQIIKSIPIADKFLVEPLVRATTITGYGLLPEGALGLRYELSPVFKFFSRSGVTRRFPTLVDRFYTLPGQAQANPGLEPETNYSFTLGIDTDVVGRLFNLLQLTYQYSENIHQYLPITTGSSIYSTQNSGIGQMLSLFHIVKVNLMPWFDMTKTFSINLSRLDRTRGKYNNLPWAKNVYVFRFHDPSDRDRWSVALIHTWVSDSISSNGTTLPSYVVGDVAVDYALSWFRIGAKVENISDDHYQAKLNEPAPGRTYVVSMSAQF